MGEPRILSAGIRDVQVGDRVTVVEPANLYECTLGDDVFVGPFCEIQRGVTIGPRTRVQSHTLVCELVEIGADCFIGHGVVFTNDLLRGGPAGGDRDKWQPTTVGDHVSIGSNATILPVTIAPGTVIGAGAVVTKDITEQGVYVGNPMRRIG
jgi:acetyltransferase-like isoleucine patch superfamily enzyme